MQYFIYHKTGERKIVRDEEFNELLKGDEWFKTPLEAEAAKKIDIKAIEKQEKAKAAAEAKKQVEADAKAKAAADNGQEDK